VGSYIHNPFSHFTVHTRCSRFHSLGKRVLVSPNAELKLANAALQANEVLLELSLLLLEATNLVLKFHILNLLAIEVLLKVTLNSTHKINQSFTAITYLVASSWRVLRTSVDLWERTFSSCSFSWRSICTSRLLKAISSFTARIISYFGVSNTSGDLA
jgi:hypothetical protein